ncbi:hypothetical protein DESHY_60330 [Desulforamulus hydrothermalis Lam5 = DSM 18033]|uniref:Uncharacterized protein n=1 Tax=Desulforamulus hydrothermalis Lam5 = DSM 18033 TaxID=1121428 RepID=K8EBT8_9FIRM|nr:hypothetical protein DESHY_60330 [Desulforamulus hydrothermalis Lam5 = DSM 18033]
MAALISPFINPAGITLGYCYSKDDFNFIFVLNFVVLFVVFCHNTFSNFIVKHVKMSRYNHKTMV